MVSAFISNAHQAVQQAQRYIYEGYDHIVDIDLQNFFDEVDHVTLLQRLYNKVECLRLIYMFMKIEGLRNLI